MSFASLGNFQQLLLWILFSLCYISPPAKTLITWTVNLLSLSHCSLSLLFLVGLFSVSCLNWEIFIVLILVNWFILSILVFSPSITFFSSYSILRSKIPIWFLCRPRVYFLELTVSLRMSSFLFVSSMFVTACWSTLWWLL